MYRLLYVLAAALCVTGLVMLLPKEKAGTTYAVAADTQALSEVAPQLEVMIELAPTFIALQRVQAMNLVNGLFLSDDQLDEIISHLGELQRMENDLVSQLPLIRRHQAEFATARDLLGQVETVLVAGEQPDSGLAVETNRIVTDLYTTFISVGELTDAIDAFKPEIAAAIYNLLTNNQKILVQEYVECIIPPEGDPMNPERIGQVKGGMYDELRNIRGMDDRQYELAREHLVNEIWQQILKHCPDEQQGAKYEKQRIAGVLASIRQMDGTEFELKRDDLADLLIPYENTIAPQRSGTVDEELVRSRIWKFFVENNHVDMLKAYRNNR